MRLIDEMHRQYMSSITTQIDSINQTLLDAAKLGKTTIVINVDNRELIWDVLQDVFGDEEGIKFRRFGSDKVFFTWNYDCV